MKTTSVFSKNAIAYANGKRYIVNQGGTSSSKTYSILQLLQFIASTSDGLLISIVSENMPHLKRGAMRDFFKILASEGLYNRKHHNKTENTYQIGTSIIEFFSADNEGKALGSRRDILYLNECNNLKSATVEQMIVRTKRAIFIDFNPVEEFFVHTDIVNDPKRSPKTEFIKSTYKDNEHLDESIVQEIESKRDNPKFANWWRVYGLGEVGVLEGLVFDPCELVDDMPETDKRKIGVDFGFTNDPTAIVDVREFDGWLYLDEISYRTGMTNADIATVIKSLNLSRVTKIVADSSEAKSIAELEQRGLNIHGAIKGAGSVNAGIDVIKSFKGVRITKRSTNLVKEWRNYMYAKDRSGKTLNEPVDLWNHGIDATRYAAAFDRISGKRRATGSRWNFPS